MRVTDDMVSRFLSWKLPSDFCPDHGISFDATRANSFGPTGTNLLHAGQAREMLEHVFGPEPERFEKLVREEPLTFRERAATSAMQGILASFSDTKQFQAVQKFAVDRATGVEQAVAFLAARYADALASELAKGQ